MRETYFDTGQAADYLGGRFSSYRIRAWCEKGYIEGALRPGPGMHWSIPKSGLDKWLAKIMPKRRKSPKVSNASENPTQEA